ncbi:MAG: hypothetical protein JKY54_12180 [Flavobacteriales bacterium]|nr:hypothetical protein [Flavobacteriales bacterium]
MTARVYYHLSNACSVLFFAVIGSNYILKIEGKFIHSIWYILAPLLLGGFLLSALARRKDPTILNPVKEGKITKVLSLIGLILIIAAAFVFSGDLMAIPIMALGILAQITALILSFFLKEQENDVDDEIINELTEDNE